MADPIRSARDLINRVYGVSTSSRESAAGVTAGVTSAELLRPDSRRVAFIYYNLSVADWHYLRPGGLSATSTGSFAVGPGGGGVSFTLIEDGEMVAFPWQVISTAALSAYYLVETLIEHMPAST